MDVVCVTTPLLPKLTCFIGSLLFILTPQTMVIAFHISCGESSNVLYFLRKNTTTNSDLNYEMQFKSRDGQFLIFLRRIKIS